MPLSKYESLVGQLVRPLVDNHDAIEITGTKRGEAIEIAFRVDDAETGRVIGRGGSNINAIRTLVEFTAERNGDRVQVTLLND